MTSQTATKGRVFFSYSREDSEFLDEIVRFAETYGYQANYDRGGIRPGENWETRLRDLITSSETFVCVVSANWLASKSCRAEYDIAIETGRKFLPVLIEEIESNDLPDGIRSIQFVSFTNPKKTYAVSVSELVRNIETDQDWMEQQTALLNRAIRWDNSKRSNSELLRGRALKDTGAWLLEDRPVGASIPGLVSKYLDASEEHDRDFKNTTYKRILVWFGAIAALLVSGLGWISAIQYQQMYKLQIEEVQVRGLAAEEARKANELRRENAEAEGRSLELEQLANAATDSDLSRREARDEISKIIANADEKTNRDFVYLINAKSIENEPSSYRLRLALAYALANQDSVIPMADRADVLEVLRFMKNDLSDPTFQVYIDKAIENVKKTE